MLTYIIGSIEAPRYAIRTSSIGLRPDERPIGIQTRIELATLIQGGISSPILPAPPAAPKKKALA